MISNQTCSKHANIAQGSGITSLKTLICALNSFKRLRNLTEKDNSGINFGMTETKEAYAVAVKVNYVLRLNEKRM